MMTAPGRSPSRTRCSTGRVSITSDCRKNSVDRSSALTRGEMWERARRSRSEGERGALLEDTRLNNPSDDIRLCDPKSPDRGRYEADILSAPEVDDVLIKALIYMAQIL